MPRKAVTRQLHVKTGGVSGSYFFLYEREKTRKGQHQEDHEKMNQSHAQLIEWIIFEEYGTKVARENGI